MHLFELRPNSSLTPRSAAVFFGSLGAVSLGIGLGFMALGLWPILPFAGLELAALGAAIAVSIRRGQARESIVVDGDTVLVRKARSDSAGRLHRVRETRFQRAWTRVEWRTPGNAHWPCRLVLASGRRSEEVGAFLVDSERRRLRDRLRLVIPEDVLPADAGPGDGAGTDFCNRPPEGAAP